MTRHVFYSSDTLDAKSARAARAVASKLGATVLKVSATAGTMLVEAETPVMRKVAAALPGWRHSVETTARLPERPRIASRAPKRAAA